MESDLHGSRPLPAHRGHDKYGGGTCVSAQPHCRDKTNDGKTKHKP